MKAVSIVALRRFVVAAQGYASRFRRATAAEVEREIRRLSAVQLDSIATVARSHRLVLATRIGDYPEDALSALLASGRVVEYWAHEASLVPAEDWPLLRRKSGDDHPWWGPVVTREPELARHVLETLRERGPLAARHFEGRNAGSWWEWKPAKRMLEALWSAGEVVIAGRQGFQRLYDVPERVLPRSVLEAPVPSHDEMARQLVLRAVSARGALTESGIAEHYRFRGRTKAAAPAVQALVDEGVLRRVPVEDGRAPVVVAADAELDGSPTAPVLLSPFDNLLWDRPFAERLFGFRHLIEVYKREHERAYGYYVLPFLWRDRIVGRADLKSNRREGLLQVKALHLEPGVRRSSSLDEAFERAALRLARSIGLSGVARA